MTKKRILIVASYPIANSTHGGQKRTKALYDFYKTIFTEVVFVGVFYHGSYKDHGETDILINQKNVVQRINDAGYISDLTSGDAINIDLDVRHKMATLLREFKPDVIHIEQIYPYLGLAPLLKELSIQSKLIFGSQNIEYTMKENIYRILGIPESISWPIVRLIQEQEEMFSREADLVIAVNEEDASTHKKMGAKKVIVAPNGIEKVTPSEQAVSHWRKLKEQEGIEHIATFVASSHPPNWGGFLEMMGDDMMFIPKTAKVLIAGGIADYFKETYKYGKPTHKQFWDKVIPVGVLSDDELSGLIKESEVILLPIATPRGSNLKTAEAILSEKKIVATDYTFHGFEEYRNLPNIFIANNQEDFRNSFVKALQAKYINPTPAHRELAKRVQWQYCLAPLRPALKRMAMADLLKKPVIKVHKVVRKGRSLVRRGLPSKRI